MELMGIQIDVSKRFVIIELDDVEENETSITLLQLINFDRNHSFQQNLATDLQLVCDFKRQFCRNIPIHKAPIREITVAFFNDDTTFDELYNQFPQSFFINLHENLLTV